MENVSLVSTTLFHSHAWTLAQIIMSSDLRKHGHHQSVVSLMVVMSFKGR